MTQVSADLSDVDRLVATFEKALRQGPEGAVRLVGLAEILISRGHVRQGIELCRRAITAGAGSGEVDMKTRRVLSQLVPDYHVSMMNDLKRNAAWDGALRRAVRPGSHVLEIGTGGGMLALMAARAGAGRVTTCEHDPVMAMLAREIAAQNGYGDRISVIQKRSEDLDLVTDLGGPAELLFCDIFGASFFHYDPLPALIDARRLLVPGARMLPARGSVHIALADWPHAARRGRIQEAGGFDVSRMSAFTQPRLRVGAGDPELALLSAGVEAFGFDFSEPRHPIEGRREILLDVGTDAAIAGVVQWIRLDLDECARIESKPEPGLVQQLGPLFYPWPRPMPLLRGEQVRVGVEYCRDRLDIWLIEKASEA